MLKRLTFRQKLFFNFAVIFTVFTVLVLIFQFDREKNFRRSMFEQNLDNIAELTHQYIEYHRLGETGNYPMLDSLTAFLPRQDTRITVIDRKGLVLFDSEVGEIESMENHLERPEIQEALKHGTGANVRTSATTGHSYYYFARAYPDLFVRTAALYNSKVRENLHVERLFIAYLALLFLVFSFLLTLITRRLSYTIKKLRDFSIQLRSGRGPTGEIHFPDDELGEISSQITSFYWELEKAQRDLLAEQEKLFNHLNALNEGIAFFSPEKKKILTNQQFIQNLNLISGESTLSSEDVFTIPELASIQKFIDHQLIEPTIPGLTELPSVQEVVEMDKRFFAVRCLFFADRSFEVVITDVTKLEKRKRIKHQMTGNIAHELKTPVTSILGYLETLQGSDVPEETRKLFLERACKQTERLSDLIGDITSLTRIEEAGESFSLEPLEIRKIITEVHEHLKIKLDSLDIRVHIDIPEKMVISGNPSLLYSVFYNLFDNSIKYGGQGIEIKLRNYLEDRKYYYFSYANTGNTVEEKHLVRIFERFYRVDDGRSRERGGTGLGLSIVKNAIELHGGKITAKTYSGGGLEFLFSLRK
ncbi:MAG: ATP-binding protein [Bacteroidales bacterium]